MRRTRAACGERNLSTPRGLLHLRRIKGAGKAGYTDTGRTAMNRVVHFEIHAENLKRAARFYEELFGWKFDRWMPEEYWLITTGPLSEPGINGGLFKRRGTVEGSSVIAYVCTIQVASVDDSIERAAALGGANVVPKKAMPGVGWLAYSKDTEGNIFGMMQNDPEAK